MLMEPDEYTSQERALTDKAKELIEQHELDWGKTMTGPTTTRTWTRCAT